MKFRALIAAVTTSAVVVPTAYAAPAVNAPTIDALSLKEASAIESTVVNDPETFPKLTLELASDKVQLDLVEDVPVDPQPEQTQETTVEDTSSAESLEQETFTPAPPSNTGNAVVDAVMTRAGAPYVWGATGPDSFDCSGLMYWAYQQVGKTIPRTSQAQIAGGTPVSLDNIQPGDIVGYYDGITHVGMYIGNGQIFHASTYGVPAGVADLHMGPITGIARY